MRQLNHVALFAGLGGFIAAASRCGLKTIYANDNNEACCETLRESYPNLKVSSKDIRELSLQSELGSKKEIDLLSAGFPCQSFSIAGDNLGFEDPRGQLFFEIIRICKELENPPKVLLLENVSHLKQYNNGSRLSVVLQNLRSAGYWVREKHAMILNSKDLCESAQNRERLYIIAFHSKYFKKNYFDAEMKSEHSTPGEPLWDIINTTKKCDDSYYLPHNSKYWNMIKSEAKTYGKNYLFQVRRTSVRTCPENTCPTLTANMGGGGHNIPFLIDKFGVRKLTEEECLKLQGYKDFEVKFPNKVAKIMKYSMIGNAIYPKVAELIIKQIDFSKTKVRKNDRMEFSA